MLGSAVDDQRGPTQPTRQGLTPRLGATVVVLLLCAASLFAISHASFTDTQSGGPTPITTGIVHVVLAAPAGDHGLLTVGPIDNLAEGDTMQRVVELTNDTTVGAAGTTGLASTDGLTLSTSVSGTNAGSDIVTDYTNGLEVRVDACATAPTESGGTFGPWTYTCSGGFTFVFQHSVNTLDLTPQDLTSAAPNEGASTYYRIEILVPTSYADAYSYNGGVCSTGGTQGVTEQFQNCSLSITFDFTATQRAGTNQ